MLYDVTVIDFQDVFTLDSIDAAVENHLSDMAALDWDLVRWTPLFGSSALLVMISKKLDI